MSEWRGVFNHEDHDSTGGRAWCRCGEWCYPPDPCSCCEKQALGDQTAAEVLAEVTELHAVVDRVIRLHSRWRQEVLVTLGKPLLDMPGGVLSIPLPSAERQLWHALDGGESDE